MKFGCLIISFFCFSFCSAKHGLGWNWVQSEEIVQIHNENSLSDYSCIIVYQFGKVGSCSLHDLFSQFRPTIHTHTPEPIIDMMNKKEKFLVVNAMRNVFDRNVSCLFEAIKISHQKLPEKYQVEDILNVFPDRNFYESHTLKNWYTDFNELLDLHPFDKPFDFRRKFYLERKEQFDVLVLRYEDIDDWARIIGRALNLRKLNIPKVNVSEIPMYMEFKRAVRFSDDIADFMLSIDYMQHFYTEQELLYFRQKYLDQSECNES